MRTFLERQLTVAPLFTVSYLHQSGPHGGFVTRENAKMIFMMWWCQHLSSKHKWKCKRNKLSESRCKIMSVFSFKNIFFAMICKLSRTSNSSRLHEFGGLFKLYLWSLNTSYVSVFVPLRAKTTSTSFLYKEGGASYSEQLCLIPRYLP